MSVASIQRIQSKTTEFRAKVDKVRENGKFQTPICPQMDADSTQIKKFFSQDRQHYKKQQPAGGFGSHKGLTPKVLHRPIFDPQFLNNRRQIFSQKLSGASCCLQCVNCEFGPDLASRIREKPCRVFGVYSFGANPHPSAGN